MIARAVRLLARTGTYGRAVRGWRGDLVCFGLGIASALGFAPFSCFALLLLGYGGLVLRLDGAARARRPIRAALRAGFLFGFGQFLLGLHWIGYAFLVDAADHAWQLPFVAVLFPGGLALFPALAAAAAMALWRNGAARIFLFALCFGLGEWLRGHVLSGFPWNIAAYGWAASPQVMQSAALFGSYGLSLLTILFGAALADLFRARPRWRLVAALATLFAVLWLGGAVRLAMTPTSYVEGVRLRLVQPNIPQAEKYAAPYVMRNWRRLVELTTSPSDRAPSVVIWPEAAPPFFLAYEPAAMDWIAHLNQSGTVLMTGALRVERSGGETRYHNSFFAFDRGQLGAVYDKAHLVPFGEYLPFEQTLSGWGLDKLTGISGSFAPGPGPRSLRSTGLPTFGPLICYEILFPGEVVGRHRPQWLVNVTDDSWFGPWAGPHQHLVVAKSRAIEEGLPIVRSANTGISAIIDPTGRVVGSIALNSQGILDGSLPRALPAPPYCWARPLWFWLILTMFAAIARRFWKEK